MSQRFQRPHPAEFRREAERLVRATGRRYQDVARELGISGKSLKPDALDRGGKIGTTPDTSGGLVAIVP